MQTTACTSRCLLAPDGHHDLSDEELSAAAGGVPEYCLSPCGQWHDVRLCELRN